MVANANTVKATETSFRVIAALAERDGAGVSDLAGDLDLSRSGVHKHLTTLCELGYVRKDGDTYRASDLFFSLGTGIRNADPLFEVSHEPLVELASAMNERVALYARRDGELTCLYSTADRNKPDRESPDGDRQPLDGSFVGDVVRVQENGSDSGPTGGNVDELESIRGHQIAFETVDDVRRIAMPVFGPDDASVGVVVVSGTTGRLKGRRVGEDAPGLMVSTIESIEAAYAEATDE
jgi:DNA-binding IclR family transcriptional regulator